MANKLKQESPKGHHQSMGQFYSKLRPADVESLHKLVYVHKDHLANTPFGKHIPGILNATSHAEVKRRIYQADKDVGGAFTANIRGGILPVADNGTHILNALSSGKTITLPYSQMQPNGYNPKLGGVHNYYLGQNDYNQPYAKWMAVHPWMHVFGPLADDIFKQQEAMIPKLKQLKEQIKIDAQRQQRFMTQMALNDKKINELGKTGGDFKNIQAANAQIQQQVNTINLRATMNEFFAFRDKVVTLTIITDPAQQKEWIQGYDDMQWQFNRWTHEVWRSSLDPTQWKADSIYNLGKIWAAMYNRSWQPQIDWRSGVEVFFSKLSEGIGIFLAGAVAPFRLAAMIDPELDFGVSELADALGVPTIESEFNSPIDIGI